MIPVLSIITVVLNQKELLKNTVESVRKQSYKNYEHLIIDGCSTDGTIEYLQNIKDKKIKWLSKKDNGYQEAMNRGIKKASGVYVNFLNAGDVYQSEKTLSEIFDRLTEQPDMIYGDYFLYWKEKNFSERVNSLPYTIENLRKFGTRTLNHQSLFVKRVVIPFYKKKYSILELDWHFDLVKKVKTVKYINEPLIIYESGGKSHRHFWKWLFQFVLIIQDREGFRQNLFNLPYYFYLVLNNNYNIFPKNLKAIFKKRFF